MKTSTRSSFGPWFFFLILLCCTVAEAQAQPERTGAVQGEADPYTVTLYSSANYVNPIGTWKIAPGMRMLKIAQLGKIPYSILLGSKVGAILFPEANFTSALQGVTSITFDFGSSPQPKDTYLIPYWRLKNSTPAIYSKYVPHNRTSLIIHRKDVDDFLGVYLQSGNNFGQLYPLPDRAGEAAVIYNKITAAGPFTLSLEPGGMGSMSIYPSLTPPNPNNIAVTITTPEGATVKIPEPNSTITRFDLRTHGVQKISSLMIQYKGPFNEQAYLPVQAVRAPSAPEPPKPPPVGVGEAPKPPPVVAPGTHDTDTVAASPSPQAPASGQIAAMKLPDISGEWGSSIGLTYEIKQAGDRFEWTVRSSDELGRGQLKGSDVSASWVGRQGRGSAQGKITVMDAAGRATQIE